MSLNLKEDADKILDRRYNVEFLIGNSGVKTMTINNVLRNIDGTYFWFSSEEDGMDCIRQDRVVIMSCTERK